MKHTKVNLDTLTPDQLNAWVESLADDIDRERQQFSLATEPLRKKGLSSSLCERIKQDCTDIKRDAVYYAETRQDHRDRLLERANNDWERF